MKRHHSSSSSWLAAVSVICWWGAKYAVIAGNVTVDDANTSISYSPSSSWFTSQNLCSKCLSPSNDSAFSSTYHVAMHALVTVDDDDVGPTLTSPPPPSSGPDEDDGDVDADDKTKGKQKHGGGAESRRSSISPPRADADDPNFVDVPVLVQYNFTGSAIYLFCIEPLDQPALDGSPTAMNLTFIVDQKTVGTFMSTGTQTSAGFLSGKNVLAHTGMAEGPHSLTVSVGLNSVFLFDYLVYTTQADLESPPSPTNNPSGTQLSASTGNPSVAQTTHPAIDESQKKHNTATFAGAVGGSVGVLGVLSLGLAISIIRRRRQSAIRERRSRDREALHTTGPEDSPVMLGPAPFVPRFFPGTVVPNEPPSYLYSVAGSTSLSASSSLEETLEGPYLSRTTHPRDMSYADIPPITPPPIEDGLLPPPPPFPAAISDSPVMTQLSLSPLSLVGVLAPPGISGSEEYQQFLPHPHSPPVLDVGVISPDSAVQPTSVSIPPSILSRSNSRAPSSHSLTEQTILPPQEHLGDGP